MDIVEDFSNLKRLDLPGGEKRPHKVQILDGLD